MHVHACGACCGVAFGIGNGGAVGQLLRNQCARANAGGGYAMPRSEVNLSVRGLVHGIGVYYMPVVPAGQAVYGALKLQRFFG